MSPAPTFQERWQNAVRCFGDREFLAFEDPEGDLTKITYKAMDLVVAEVAGSLRDLGVRRGDCVHLVLPNSIGFVVIWLACSRLGAWFIPSDPASSSREIADVVSRTGPVVSVCDPSRHEDYLSALDAAGQSRTQLLVLDQRDVEVTVLRGPSTAPPVTSDPHDRLAVMFTSGTTSAPKGVELTQANYAFAGDVMAAASALNYNDRNLVVLPLFHVNAQFYSVSSAISAGASVALTARFSASRFVEQATRLGATHASLFAAPIRMILDRTPPGATLNLRHAWFAQNISDRQYLEISDLLGCRPRQIYGMTETVPAVLQAQTVGGDPSSIGFPALGCHVRVVDERGELANAGTSGTIQVGGFPGQTLFRGYLDAPDITAAAFVEQHEDGFVWFDTGDRATVDQVGQYFFDGRRSDVLKVAGENVSLVEIEYTLARHPLIFDVAVIGAPDAVRDEVPEAYVVLSQPARSDAVAEIETWATGQLSPAKRPRAYHLVDRLPRTSVGKVRKFQLERDPTERTVS